MEELATHCPVCDTTMLDVCEFCRLRAQLAAAQKECEAQARINGMGSEREARLDARVKELEQSQSEALRREADLRIERMELRAALEDALDRWEHNLSIKDEPIFKRAKAKFIQVAKITGEDTRDS